MTVGLPYLLAVLAIALVELVVIVLLVNGVVGLNRLGKQAATEGNDD